MERIPVRYDRALKPEWLDFALDQAIKYADDDACRKAVREYLACRVTGKEATIKTATQLMRVVSTVSTIPQDRLLALHQCMTRSAPDERTPVRLQLLLEASPFFTDCVTAIRKLSILGQEGIGSRQLFARMTTLYGDRAIVPRSVRNVLTTLLWLGLIQKSQDHRWVPDLRLLSR